MTPGTVLKTWLFRLGGPEAAPIVLVQRRVFVLPTRAGLVFAICLLLMLAGSINYALSLGFALTFLLAGLGIVHILHTFRNLARLEIAPLRCEPVFVGERALFALELTNRRAEGRYALMFHRADAPPAVTDIAAADSARVTLAVATARRGRLRLGRVRVETRHPLGLVRAWSYVEPDVACLVYPCPEKSPPPLPPPSAEGSGMRQSRSGSEDFTGLRGHQPADSPRHIAWKAVAREAPLLTKQFSGGAAARVVLDWHGLPPALDTEARLSRLTRWVLDAQQQGLNYALRLPGRELPAGHGEVHFRACLEALALYGET
ncbi:MAG: DUF58 domain-containing protein [Pseudomonadota bacterium]